MSAARQQHRAPTRAFTLVELLATVAVLAVLMTAAVFYTASYVQRSKTLADQSTLQTLNDALTRYKTQGGNVNALTVGADIGGVISKLQTPTTWAGMTHQFLQVGVTYPARSLLAVGSGAQYRFASYNSYAAETPTGTTPTSTYPYGFGIGSMVKASAGVFTNIYVNSTTSGWVCFQDQAGTKRYYAVATDPNSSTAVSPPSATSYTFWACASGSDPTASGTITYFQAGSNQLTSLNISGLTALKNLSCASNQLTSLNVSGLTALTSLHCESNQLTSLNASGLTALTYLYCSANQLTSLDVSGAPIAQFNCSSNQLTSLLIPNMANNGPPPFLPCFDFTNNLLNSAAVDAMFNSIPAAAHSFSPPHRLDVSGTGNAAPTAASLTARNALTGGGWALMTN